MDINVNKAFYEEYFNTKYRRLLRQKKGEHNDKRV
jgi:hypothetical protein